MASKTETRPRRASLTKARPPARAPVAAGADEPLYLQLVRALKDEIVSGVFPVGSQLPTEEELCERFKVSRYTVREALRRLRQDNLVSSRQGAGTTVVPPHPADSFVHEVMSINDLVAFATGVRFAIDTIEMIGIDEQLSARTGIATGEEWLAVRGFRHTEGGEWPVPTRARGILGEWKKFGQNPRGIVFVAAPFKCRLADARRDAFNRAAKLLAKLLVFRFY